MTKKAKFFVLGDSISIDYGSFLKSFISERLDYGRKGEEFYGKCDLNDLSINGRDSDCVLEYLKEAFSKGFKTDIMLLNCGLHDVKTEPASGIRAVPEDRYAANLKEIAKILKSHSVKVFWVRISPVDDTIHNTRNSSFHRFNKYVTEYNNIADKIMREAGIPLIDLNSFTLKLGTPESIFRDHVHFIENVSRLQAAFIAGHILAAL